MHIIAYCYHSNLSDLEKMPRKKRKMWYEFILLQKDEEAKAINSN